MQLYKHKHLTLNLLCVVCDRNKREKVEDILGKREAFFNLITSGKGTANSRILNYLGLGETEKAVFFSILPTDAAQEAAEAIDTKLQLTKPGRGILFATQVRQGCYHKPVEFAGNASGGITMQDTPYHLIIAVLNRGYSEEVMDIARACGAKGGTVLHARSLGTAGMEKFFGITIAPEKELLMIVAQNSEACDIMSGIAQKAGPETDAGAVSFSLPVTDVRGIQTAKIE